MNSHRDNVKDVLAGELGKLGIELDELPAEIADEVFNVLGITEEQQDMTGAFDIVPKNVNGNSDEGASEHDEQLSLVIMTLEHWEKTGKLLSVPTEDFKKLCSFINDIKDHRGYVS